MTPDELLPGYELRPAWRLDDPQIAADAIAFWARLGILPPGVTPEQRAKELVAVVYKDDEIVGVQTGVIEPVEQVRTKLAMIRIAVDPAHRRMRVATGLTLYSRALLQAWAGEHPDAQLGGLGALVGGAELAERATQGFWPQTKFILAGFRADGRQLRISWFEDFLLEDY
jgi:GNAT superfamily N-acetyltransferase